MAQMGDELEQALRTQQQAFGVILEEIKGQIDGIGDGHQLLNQKFDTLEVKFDRLEDKVDTINLRLSRVEHQVGLNGAPGRKRRK